MAYVLKEKLANRANYGSKRSTSKIKWIVWHYTAVDGDSDEAVGNYFARVNARRSSAHYAVDDDSVTQCVPDNYVAYSVGGSKYNDCAKTGGGTLYGVVNNTNSISIEICDTCKDGAFMHTAATLENVIALTKVLMKKYNINIDHVIRHFDVTGKYCPVYYMDSKMWATAKAMIMNTVITSNNKQENIVSSTPTYTYDDFIRECKTILGLPSTATIWQVYNKTVTISATINRSHPLVTPWERLLKSLGYYSGSIEADKGKTPVFGAGMTQAMKKFQTYVVKQTNVKNIDGEATAKGKTWKKALKMI